MSYCFCKDVSVGVVLAVGLVHAVGVVLACRSKTCLHAGVMPARRRETSLKYNKQQKWILTKGKG